MHNSSSICLGTRYSILKFWQVHNWLWPPFLSVLCISGTCICQTYQPKLDQYVLHIDCLCLLSADPNEEVNLAENTDYADVLATMVDVIDTNTSLVVSFSTFGRITEEEAVVDGMWVLGACSDTTF